MSFERSIAELREFAMKADAKGDMRLSISFKHQADSARFLAEIRREFQPMLVADDYKSIGHNEMQLHGINIRIM